MMVIGVGQLRFTVEEAQDFALERFDVRASASQWPSDRDQDFLLEISRGECYVLKIADAADRAGFETQREL